LEEKYKLNPEAISDILESVKYYEERSQKVADEFINDVFSKIDQLSKRPESHSIYFEESRKASLSKFPFNIIYTIVSPVIVILAVWHKKREERWKIRLKK
jgi:plasmid stabilization system protein ParE